MIGGRGDKDVYVLHPYGILYKWDMRIKRDSRKPEIICKEFETPVIRDKLKMMLTEDSRLFALVNYSKSIIKIFDLKVNKIVHSLSKFCEGYKGSMISKSAVFYNHKIIAVSWSLRDIFFIDVEADKIIKKFTGPFESQNSIQFTEDRKYLISTAKNAEVGIDGAKACVCVWEINTCELIHKI